MRLTNTQQAFLELVRAGLWAGDESTDLGTESLVWDKVYQFAAEQSVVGLVLAGVEHANVKLPQELLLQWIGEAQILEQQNLTMNKFIRDLFKRLLDANINAVLIKGQGVAQNYGNPLWRSCGDIDLLMDSENYEKAKALLIPMSDHVETENKVKKHQGLYIKDFLIELHGAMPFMLSEKVDKVVDKVIDKVNTDNTDGTGYLLNVAVPKADEHLMIVFTHFLHHFFIEGVGLRQICDWCMLLWRFRSELDLRVLESRINKAGLKTEWQVFGAMAVEYLGMPKDAMPMYDSRYKVKGERVLERILKSGNMGHNNDLSYRSKYSGLTYKLVALWRRIKDFTGFTMIFPVDAPKFFVYYVLAKIK